MLVESQFKIEKMGRFGAMYVACVLADPRACRRRHTQADEGFSLSHRKMVGDDFPAGFELALGVG